MNAQRSERKGKNENKGRGKTFVKQCTEKVS